jgi:hypothetical protein
MPEVEETLKAQGCFIANFNTTKEGNSASEKLASLDAVACEKAEKRWTSFPPPK